MMNYDVAVVGAGASGLMAAIVAGQSGARTLLVEARSRAGSKILASGNGRCNMSHQGFRLENFHSDRAHFPAPVLERFDEDATLTFFHDLGLETVVDDRGRIYPAALQAGAVLDILRMSAHEAGVESVFSELVQALEKNGSSFILHSNHRDYLAQAVVVACGGRAAPALGGTDAGYTLLEAFGHRRNRLAPGIVQLKTDIGALKALKGQKWDCRLSLFAGDQRVAQEEGEVLFTAYGLSGPATIQLSSAAQRLRMQDQKARLAIDFFPAKSHAELRELLQARIDAHPQRSRLELFIGLLPRIFGAATLTACELKPQNALASTLDSRSVEAIVRQLKAWPQSIVGSLDYKEAQVTLGGIVVDDFDPESLASWLCPGLYACGEVLDVDGDCGGYNLQWAWSSGFVAGSEAAAYRHVI